MRRLAWSFMHVCICPMAVSFLMHESYTKVRMSSISLTDYRLLSPYIVVSWESSKSVTPLGSCVRDWKGPSGLTGSFCYRSTLSHQSLYLLACSQVVEVWIHDGCMWQQQTSGRGISLVSIRCCRARHSNALSRPIFGIMSKGHVLSRISSMGFDLLLFKSGY